jgi:2-amino-4-hydroxy-6-hydroxymethyldihydropteridine diphosphokinase
VSLVRAYVGLGANLGDPAATLAWAVGRLAELPEVRVRGVSRLYATRPVGVEDQPDFHNAVVAADVRAGDDVALDALRLLEWLKALERDAGRRRRRRWGPRELDLDLLVFGRHVIHVPRTPAARSEDPGRAGVQWLDVPHVAAVQRAFVLAPLADLAPRLVPPGWGVSVAGALRRRLAVEGPGAVRVVGAWDAGLGRWFPAAAARRPPDADAVRRRIMPFGTDMEDGMTEQRDLDRWGAIDARLESLLGVDDPVLAATLTTSEAGGLPPIAVSALEGRLLQSVVRMVGARRILEIGTLGGYSAIWMARALPRDGRLISLELVPHHAQVARRNIERAGLADRVEVRVGRAADTLAAMEAETVEPFDLVFIDADKRSNPDYLDVALRLTRPGSVIVVDNVVRRLDGGDPDDPDVAGTIRVLERMGADPRLSATALQVVGRKGYDGLALALVLPPA